MEEVSTLFLVGFPDDFKEREFVNLFAFAAGFEGASLKYPDCSADGWSRPVRQIIGFARFQSKQEAMLARDHLNGKCIDQDRGSILKVEMAKKNLFIPAKLKSPLSVVAVSPQFHSHLHPIHEASSVFSPLYSTVSHSHSSSSSNSTDLIIPVKPIEPTINDSSKSLTFLPGENPPCNTLYVGNLPTDASEGELLALFQPYPGFRRLSFKIKPNGPMCFVEFESVACATLAMDSLYGTLLSTSHKGGIRLSYSKNPLGVRPPFPTRPPTDNFESHLANIHLSSSALYNGSFNIFG